MNETKDRLDDLASLFIPDILHHMSPSASGSAQPGTNIKQEDFEYNYNPQRESDGSTESPTNNSKHQATNVGSGGNGASTSANNYNNFINNNNFISSTGGGLLNNASSSLTNAQSPPSFASQNPQFNVYNPFESNIMMHMNPHYNHDKHRWLQHMSVFQMPQYNQGQQESQSQSQVQNPNSYPQLQQSSTSQEDQYSQFLQFQQQQQQHQQNQLQNQQNQQQQHQQQQQQFGLSASNSTTNFLNTNLSKTPNRELSWLSNSGLDSLMMNNNGINHVYNSNSPFVQSSEKVSSPEPSVPVTNLAEDDTTDQSLVIPPVIETTVSEPAKKKLKIRRRDIKGSEYVMDYNTKKCRTLLDFKKVPELSTDPTTYKIIDKDNNEVSIDFNGFLNGRFLTNDTDNNNYIFTKHSMKTSEDGRDAKNENSDETTQSEPAPDRSVKQDPKVISCYRRNYIQISLNMNVNGYKSKDKLLKVRSSEYGYSITRVIKYFKIEVSASTNISNARSVPIFIKEVPKEKEKDAKDGQKSDKKQDDKEPSIQLSAINDREHIVILNDETPIQDGEIDKFFIIRKLQFKNATPNNGNLTFQNYYHLRIKLSAVVADLYYDDYVDDDINNGIGADGEGNGGGNSDNNEITLFELMSEPIIVRGRNPNFYTERRDILIKGRSITSKKSFKASGNPDIDDEDDDDEELGESQSHSQLTSVIPDSSKKVIPGSGQDFQKLPTLNPKSDAMIGQAIDEDDEESSAVASSVEEDVGSMQAPLISQRTNNNDSQSRQHSSGSSSRREGYSKNGSVPPLAYSGTNSTSLDLKSINRYKYFPISNVYYLPPINVVYFPHRAHQHQKQSTKENDSNAHIEPVISERRKSSNVYFK